jgi:hypothetical protein
MRLRGGAIFDKRTKPVWPVWPKGEIPEDGSVGAHYTMDEIIEGSQYVGVCTEHRARQSASD